MGEQFGYAVGVLKLAPSVFYDLTPDEYYSIVKAHQKHEAQWFNNLGAVAYQAVGSAFAGAKYSEVFKTADEDEETFTGTSKGSMEDRNDTIEYFRNKGLLRKEVK